MSIIRNLGSERGVRLCYKNKAGTVIREGGIGLQASASRFRGFAAPAFADVLLKPEA
jgi:hypothetical protein